MNGKVCQVGGAICARFPHLKGGYKYLQRAARGVLWGITSPIILSIAVSVSRLLALAIQICKIHAFYVSSSSFSPPSARSSNSGWESVGRIRTPFWQQVQKKAGLAGLKNLSTHILQVGHGSLTTSAKSCSYTWHVELANGTQRQLSLFENCWLTAS